MVIFIKMSKLSLMKIIVEKELVPCKITALYHLTQRFKENDLPLNMTWTNLKRHGRKPYLSSSDLEELICDIKN